jgi:L-threonylcarbamoyladenylate synthase
VRVSPHPVAQKLAKEAGGVIVSTSANISGDEAADSAQKAKVIFGNKVDIIIDGGTSQGGESSTVLDLTGEEIWLLRKGPISGEEIMAVLRG